MSSDGPSLDDLIRAHRSGARLTDTQRAAARARLIARVLAGPSSSTAPFGLKAVLALSQSWGVKAVLAVAVAGVCGAAYFRARRPEQQASGPHAVPTQAVLPATAAPALESAATPSPAPPFSASPVLTARHAARPSASVSPSASLSLAAEVQLMHEVNSALNAKQPALALELLNQQHGSGYMREERAAARVFALCQLGLVESARSAGARFSRDYPRSPLAGRVSTTCAPSGTLPERPQ
jgi:hypothetical protein